MELMAVVCAAVMMGCSSGDDGQRVAYEQESVTLTFCPYEMEPENGTAADAAGTVASVAKAGNGDGIAGQQTKQGAMTRAVSSIAGVVSRLDVWIYEGGSEVTAVHQVSTDDGFGTVSVSLDRTKTYTVYAMGHNSDEAATLADGAVSFPSDIIRESMFYTAQLSPASASALSCEMQRIVGKLRIETTDNVPDGASYVTLGVATAATKWNVDGTLGGLTGRTIRINGLGSRIGQTVALNCHLLSTSTGATNYDVVVTLYDGNDGVLMTRTFSAVPIRNGYKTTYRGQLFTGGVTAAFTVGDWSEYEVVEF